MNGESSVNAKPSSQGLALSFSWTEMDEDGWRREKTENENEWSEGILDSILLTHIYTITASWCPLFTNSDCLLVISVYVANSPSQTTNRELRFLSDWKEFQFSSLQFLPFAFFPLNSGSGFFTLPAINLPFFMCFNF